MRNDRDYQNRSYNSFDRDRERNDPYHFNKPFVPGNDRDSRHREYDSWFINRAQEHDWEYDRSLGNEMEYDRAAARHSRGLGNDQGYQQSNRGADYQGDRNINSRYYRDENFSRGNRHFSDRSQPINRDEYRSERDFSHSNGGDFDRGRMYGSYTRESRNRGFNDDSRDQDARGYTSGRDSSYNTNRGSDSYNRNSSFNTDRRDYQRDYGYDQNRGFEPDRGYDRNHYDNRQRGYHRTNEFDRDQSSDRPEPRSIKDKYSSSSLHYHGITSLGGDDDRNRDRYSSSQYIGRQNSDRNYAGSGIGSSQRYRY